jgi:flagellar protein FliJ
LAKFVFSLETLLQYRERIEQNARDELFRLSYKYQVEVRHKNDLAARLKETRDELSKMQSEKPANQELQLFYLYINRLESEIRESDKKLVQLDAEVQKQKEAVIEAAKKKKTLASLKSKKEKEFIFAMEKREQKEIDELVVTRYVKKGSDLPEQAKAKKERSKSYESRTVG